MFSIRIFGIEANTEDVCTHCVRFSGAIFRFNNKLEIVCVRISSTFYASRCAPNDVRNGKQKYGKCAEYSFSGFSANICARRKLIAQKFSEADIRISRTVCCCTFGSCLGSNMEMKCYSLLARCVFGLAVGWSGVGSRFTYINPLGVCVHYNRRTFGHGFRLP